MANDPLSYGVIQENLQVSPVIRHIANTEMIYTGKDPIEQEREEFGTSDIITKGVPLSLARGAYSLIDSGYTLLTLGQGEDLPEFEDVVDNYNRAWGQYYRENSNAIDFTGEVAALFVPGTIAMKTMSAAKAGKLGLGAQKYLGHFDRAQEVFKKKAVEAAVSRETTNALLNSTFKAKALGALDVAQESLAVTAFSYVTMNQAQIFDDYSLKNFGQDVLLGAGIGGVFRYLQDTRAIKQGIIADNILTNQLNRISGSEAGTPTWQRALGLLADSDSSVNPNLSEQTISRAREQVRQDIASLIPKEDRDIMRVLDDEIKTITADKFFEKYSGTIGISRFNPKRDVANLETSTGVADYLEEYGVIKKAFPDMQGETEIFSITQVGNAVKAGDVSGNLVYGTREYAEKALARIKAGTPGFAYEIKSTKVPTATLHKFSLEAEEQLLAGTKVLNGAGKPAIVYHGTPKSFPDFKSSTGKELFSYKDPKTGKMKQAPANFFTSSVKLATGYSGISADMSYAVKGTPNIRPVKLNFKNPLIIDAGGESSINMSINVVHGAIRRALEAGNDGVIVRRANDAMSAQFSDANADIFVALSDDTIVPTFNTTVEDLNNGFIYATNKKKLSDSVLHGTSLKQYAKAIKNKTVEAGSNPRLLFNTRKNAFVDDAAPTAGDLRIRFLAGDGNKVLIGNDSYSLNKFQGVFEEGTEAAVSDGMFVLRFKQALSNPTQYFPVKKSQLEDLPDADKKSIKFAFYENDVHSLTVGYAHALKNQIAPIVTGTPGGKVTFKTAQEIGKQLQDMKIRQFQEGIKKGYTLDDLSVRLNINADEFAQGNFSNFAHYNELSEAALEKYAAPSTLKFDQDLGQYKDHDELLGNFNRAAEQESRRILVASTLSKEFGNDLPIEELSKKIDTAVANTQPGFASNFFFGGQSAFAALGAYAERVGGIALNAKQKIATRILGSLSPAISAFRDNPVALGELNFAVNLVRSNGAKFSLETLPDGRAVILNTETGKFVESAARNGENLILGKETSEFLRAWTTANSQLVAQHNAIHKATGNGTPLNSNILYFPPVDVRQRPYFALVVGPDGQKSSVVASTANELESLVALTRNKFPEVKIYYKDQIKSEKQIFDEFDGDDFFKSYDLDNAMKRAGVLSSPTPRTDTLILDELVGFINKQVNGNINKAIIALKNTEITELNFMGQEHARAAMSTRGIPNAVRTKDNPYYQYIATMLNKSRMGENEIFSQFNQTIKDVVDKGFNNVKAVIPMLDPKRGFSDAYKANEVTSKLNEIAQDYGINFDYSNAGALKEINTHFEKDVASYVVSGFNGFVANFALTVDALYHAVNIISGPLLLAPEIKNLVKTIKDPQLKADTASLLGSAVRSTNGQDFNIPSLMKLLSNSTSKLAKDKSAIEFYRNKGHISANLLVEADQFHQLVDVIANPATNKNLKKIKDVYSNTFEYLKNRTVVPINDYLQYYTADAVYQIGKSAGITDERVLDTLASQIVKRVNGNYVSGQRPILFQGPVGHAIGLFQTWTFSVMQNLARYAAEKDKAAIASFMGTQTLLFGAQSNPLFQMINSHIASRNSNREDLYSKAYSYGEIGDTILYGFPSVLGGISLYSRGDLTPINPTIIPTSLDQIPIIRSVKNYANAVATTAERINAAGFSTDALLQGINLSGISRPLSGVASLLAGESVLNSGEVVDSTIRDWTAWTRVVGGKPFDEAKMLDAHYRTKAYQAKDIAEIKELSSGLRAKIRSGQMPDDVELSELMQRYIQRGGNPNNFKRYWTTQILGKAQGDMASRIQSKLADDPKFNEWRYILGSQVIRDDSAWPEDGSVLME